MKQLRVVDVVNLWGSPGIAHLWPYLSNLKRPVFKNKFWWKFGYNFQQVDIEAKLASISTCWKLQPKENMFTVQVFFVYLLLGYKW